jgi:DnaJ-domain-containing protein 1
VELIAIVIMIVGGVAIAVFALTAFAINKGEVDRGVGQDRATRVELAASLLYQVLVAGGVAAEDALRSVRRDAGLAARITERIDVPSWAGSFAQQSSPADRERLLETAVQLAIAKGGAIPLQQYSTLLDLSFSLGFQTDALARLRERYGFDYVDHAKDARPRDADRGGGATTFFAREETVDVPALLRKLELAGDPSRQQIISAYRRLVAQHHPDKVSDKSVEAQDQAAARFIELTRAYERLLAVFRD